jgi:hypothetical protein
MRAGSRRANQLALEPSGVAGHDRPAARNRLRGKTHFASIFNPIVAARRLRAKIYLSFLQKS